MDDRRVYQVGRRDLWRARLRGWPQRLRRFDVWGLMLIGLVLPAGTGWWYADHTAFARRAVAATAVIEQIYGPIRVEREDGPPDLVMQGMLSYQVAGRTIHTRVRLANCSTSGCVAVTRTRQGQTVQIAYDPKRLTRVHLGRDVPAPINPFMMLLIGMGCLFIGAGLYTLFFDLGIPPAKHPDGRAAT